MAFENFPYSNFHELNLDWIVARVKEAYSASNPPDYPVTSVNGQTGDVIIAIPSALVRTVNGESGDVILYRNPLIQFPTTDESRWNLFRICDGNSGDARGIEFDEDGAHRIEGTRRILIYDEENQPDFPVTSVNGQTGDVRITAGVNSVNGKTGNVVTPFVNPNTDILKLDSNSNTVLWGISRDVAGGNVALYISRGAGTPQAFIRYTPDQGEAVNLPLLSSADIPESAGVVSVNTKTGVVTIYGTDILLSENSAENITNTLLNTVNNTNYILDTLSADEPGNSLTWKRGFYSPASGSYDATNINYMVTNILTPDQHAKITNIRTAEDLKVCIFAWSNNEYVGMYNNSTHSFETAYNSESYFYNDIDVLKIRKTYNNYSLAFELRAFPLRPMQETDPANTILTVLGGEDIDISAITEELADHRSRIDTLESNDSTQIQEITAMQAADTTHNQQISALQAADATHTQQVAELQSENNTQNQQISALQASQATQDQQISELYTRTGIYVVSIPNANTLPLRFPASGTDDKIKDTNKVVSMDLSVPGVQTSNWTITTYNGYLEITGTMNGTSDITLYLA